VKIVSVEPILICMPLVLDDAIPSSGGQPKRDIHTLLVKVTTDEGVCGWGEVFSNAGWMSSREAVSQIVAPRILGKDPAHIAQISADLYRGLYNCGRSGPVVFAISAIDIALWDIKAKVLGVPLYQLLGGSARKSLPAYASLLRYGSVPVIERKVAEALKRGYRFIKLHENQSAVIRAAKKACGHSVPLMVDCSCPWSVEEAIAASRELADLHLAWLEEPIYPPDDHEGLARLRSVSSTPIAAGENVSNFYEFKRLVQTGALSVLQPSVTKIGGVSELRKVFALGEAFGVTVVPHSPYFGPGLLASIHVCATQIRETPIEHYYCDFESNPFGEQIIPHNGLFNIPQQPGLGVDPDENIIDRLRVA
jgi:L-alanine-DL-glutamate epimerase-like enolase superfamily enzyme